MTNTQSASDLDRQRRIQEDIFAAHDAHLRELRRRHDAQTPQEREAAAHRRVVLRGLFLHARGLPHNCLCHEG